MVFLLDQAVGEMVLPLAFYVWALDFGAKLWPPATAIFLLRNIFCLAPGVCRNWMPDHGTAGDHMTWATVISDLPRYRTRDDQASLLHEEDMTYMAGIAQPLKTQVGCLSKLFPLLQLMFCSKRVVCDGLIKEEKPKALFINGFVHYFESCWKWIARVF